MNDVLWFENLPCCYVYPNNFVGLGREAGVIKHSPNYVNDVYKMKGVNFVYVMTQPRQAWETGLPSLDFVSHTIRNTDGFATVFILKLLLSTFH